MKNNLKTMASILTITTVLLSTFLVAGNSLAQPANNNTIISDNTTPVGTVLGYMGTWWGKITMYKSVNGSWKPFEDGYTGAAVAPLDLCRMKFPATQGVNFIGKEVIAGFKNIWNEDFKDAGFIFECNSQPNTTVNTTQIFDDAAIMYTYVCLQDLPASDVGDYSKSHSSKLLGFASTYKGLMSLPVGATSWVTNDASFSADASPLVICQKAFPTADDWNRADQRELIKYDHEYLPLIGKTTIVQPPIVDKPVQPPVKTKPVEPPVNLETFPPTGYVLALSTMHTGSSASTEESNKPAKIVAGDISQMLKYARENRTFAVKALINDFQNNTGYPYTTENTVKVICSNYKFYDLGDAAVYGSWIDCPAQKVVLDNPVKREINIKFSLPMASSNNQDLSGVIASDERGSWFVKYADVYVEPNQTTTVTNKQITDLNISVPDGTSDSAIKQVAVNKKFGLYGKVEYPVEAHSLTVNVPTLSCGYEDQQAGKVIKINDLDKANQKVSYSYNSGSHEFKFQNFSCAYDGYQTFTVNLINQNGVVVASKAIDLLIGDQSKIPTGTIDQPISSVNVSKLPTVKAPGTLTVYLIVNGQKRPIADPSAYFKIKKSWSDVKIWAVADMEQYPTGSLITADQFDNQGNLLAQASPVGQTASTITTPDSSVINKIVPKKNLEVVKDDNGQTYLLNKAKVEKMAITDLNVLDKIKVDPVKVKEVADKVIDKYQTVDKPVTADTIDDQGNLITDKYRLLKKANDSKVFVINEGVKQPIQDPQAFTKSGFKWQDIKVVPSELLDSYDTGSAITKTNPF